MTLYQNHNFYNIACLIVYSCFMNQYVFYLSKIILFTILRGNIFSICFKSFVLSKEGFKDFIASTCSSICFPKAFPKGE